MFGMPWTISNLPRTLQNFWEPYKIVDRENVKWIQFFLVYVCLFLFCVTNSRSSTAQDYFTPVQNEIMQTVLNAEGYITERLHKKFWDSVSPEIWNIEENREAFARVMDIGLAAGARFQRETWASIKQSYLEGRAVVTDGYRAAKEKMTDVDINYAFESRSRQAIQNAEMMIQAAAEKKPIVTPAGQLYLTPELINKAIAGLDASLYRFKVLANPIWHTPLREYHYPEAHISVLSDFPFIVEKYELTSPNGAEISAVSLMKRLSETDYVTITFTEHGGSFSDPTGSLIRILTAALENTGASPSSTKTVSLWRYRQSATGHGQALTSEGIIYMSARVVEVEELRGTLMFMSVTTASLLDSKVIRQDLEQFTQLTH